MFDGEDCFTMWERGVVYKFLEEFLEDFCISKNIFNLDGKVYVMQTSVRYKTV